MNKYLIEILKVQSSVILPGLGALMVASTRTGKIVFNPHLKFNDGSLARFIAEKEGIDKQEAENKIAKFIREIEAELGKGNRYEIFEFGSFFNNKDGKIDFEMKEDLKSDMSKSEVPKKEEKKAAPVKKEEPKVSATPKKEDPLIKKEPIKKEEPKKDEKKTADKVEETDIKNSFIPNVDKPKVDEKKSELKTEVKKAEKAAEKTTDEIKDTKEKLGASIPVASSSKVDSKQDKNTFTPTNEKKEEPKKEAPKTVIAGQKTTAKPADKPAKKTTDKKQKSVAKKDQKEKKKRKLWPWIVLLLILGGGGVSAYIFKDEISKFLYTGVDDEHGEEDEHSEESVENHDDEEHHVIPDSLDVDYDPELHGENAVAATEQDEQATEEVVEEVVEEEVVEEQPVVTKTNNSSPGGSYHIIGNAFGDKSNAESYVSTMNSKGYSAKILGRFDNLYLVSIKAYDSRSAANSGLSSVSGDASGAWVFKYPK